MRRRDELPQAFDRDARHHADDRLLAGKLQAAEHGSRFLRPYAQQHDGRSIDHFLIGLRDARNGEARREFRRAMMP
jgi:hypothetical protein